VGGSDEQELRVSAAPAIDPLTGLTDDLLILLKWL
jgi:hypothetical protein